MYVSHIFSNSIRCTLTHILMVASIVILTPESSFASKEASDEGAMVIVLDDCDSDNKDSTPPYGDKVFLLNSRGELIRREISGIVISAYHPWRRVISASEDGRFFVVCENVANKLTAYETSTGDKLWSLSGIFESAVFANSLVYALNTESVFTIDSTGTITKHARIGGMNIAIDRSHGCLWIVGLDIKKCDLNLHVILTVDYVSDLNAGVLSVDVNPDGSIWVAERHFEVPSNTNKSRLLKISPNGGILKTIDLDFEPMCVRVDRHDGSVWTTGIGPRDYSKIDDDWPETVSKLYEMAKREIYTHKYDSECKLIVKIAEGGHSIELDPSDGSVWFTGSGSNNIWHYSSTGTKLTTYTGVSEDQKWLAVVSRRSQDNY